MQGNEPTLEAEVVSIDGVTVPEPGRDPAKPRMDIPFRIPAWVTWQGTIKRLDPKWMPLWIVLGAVTLVAVVAIGMVAAIFGACFFLIRAILGILTGSLTTASPRGLQRR